MKLLKRELFVFLVLFILLSLSMHYKAWISHPIAHIEALPSSPLGLWHPLVLTFVAYIVVLVVRVVIYWINKIKAKRL